MNKEDLQKTLGRLRCELDALGPEAGPLKVHMNDLLNDLEQHFEDLDRFGHRAAMRDRLAALVEQFESEHPSITGMLDQVVTSLANIGV